MKKAKSIKVRVKSKSKSMGVVPASVLTAARRSQIRSLIKEQFPQASVCFEPRGNPNAKHYTPVNKATYFAVYARMGAVLLRGSTVKNLDALINVMR